MHKLLRKKSEGLAASIGSFWRDQDGQDLIEYTLLMAFVALSSAALFTQAGTNVSKIWSTTNSTLRLAATAAS
jgi:Flp pilus assembly pilin Flp